MEVSSGEKLEETHKAEQRKEDQEVAVETVEDLKPVAEVAIDGSSGTVNDKAVDESDLSSASKKEKQVEQSPDGEDLGTLGEVKEVLESAVNSVEPVVSLSKDVAGVFTAGLNSLVSDFAGSEEKEEKVVSSLKEANGFSSVEASNGTKKPELESSYEEDGPPVAEEVSKTVELPETLPSGEKNRSSEVITTMEAKAIETLPVETEKILEPSLDANGEITEAPRDLETKKVEEAKVEASEEKTEEPKEKVDDSVRRRSVEVPATEISNGIDSKTEAPATLPTISMARRTSWLGCCGLLEVLRRSDR